MQFPVIWPVLPVSEQLANPAVLGTGLEGLAAWRHLRRRYPDCQITLYTEGDAAPGLQSQLLPGMDLLVEGPLRTEVLVRHDLLVRSPGISPYRPELRAAAEAGIEITTASNLWFAAYPGARSICITGTKGKSTTTALLAQLMRGRGLDIEVAGNIGLPMLAREEARPDWWIIELSSYQLCDLRGSPTLGAILNLSDEHLDWHQGPGNYRRDKLRLAGLTGTRTLVANHADESLRHALAGQGNVRWFNNADGWQLGEAGVTRSGWIGEELVLPRLPGGHNLANLAAALSLAEAAEAMPGDPQAVLDEFAGLPHRLETIGSINGIRFVDDSLSTTPVATLAALEALQDSPVTLLVGGLDRGLDWTALAGAFKTNAPVAIIGLPDSGPHILKSLQAGGLELPGGMHESANLAEAVAKAVAMTAQGGVVLLSPGAPSFPRFRDYRDRGRVFAECAGLLERTGKTGR